MTDTNPMVLSEEQPRHNVGAASVPHDSFELRSTICETIVNECLDAIPKGLISILLTGSMARDEATIVSENGMSVILGDAEFLCIFDSRSPLPSDEELGVVCQGTKNNLLRAGIDCAVSVGAAHPNYLQKMRPHIFGYELRMCGRTVWGDPHLLDLIPKFHPRDIPLEDAWRLLCNRMIELIEVQSRTESAPAVISRQHSYHTIKLYLDMATSFLLFAGGYAPTYEQRANAVIFAASRMAKDWLIPFPIDEFSKNVRRCVDWKLGKSSDDISAASELWRPAVRDAWLLWRWELAELTHSGWEDSDSRLRKKWMKQQSVTTRIRGWAYAVRNSFANQRRRPPLRTWLRSLLKAYRASPRHWVYAAASELCFRLPWILENSNQVTDEQLDWRSIMRLLPQDETPEQPEEEGRARSWLDAARAISWNYHEFVEKTCA